ncbi:MAG: desulfoferrodoxin [Faecalibacterium sp.]|nr:desulfoferrodoxin [Faecalibacterium sp.]
MSETKFYICRHCGNIIAMVHASGVPVVCCGEPMHEIVPNTTDAAQEKHVPQISVQGSLVTVTVGSVEHPMLKEHSIQWVALETKQGIQRKEMHPEEAPKVTFALTEGDAPVAAYAYCNLHGLWKASV